MHRIPRASQRALLVVVRSEDPYGTPYSYEMQVLSAGAFPYSP